jgi:hypothetical protein
MATNLNVLSYPAREAVRPYQLLPAFPYPVNGRKQEVALHLAERPDAYLPSPQELDLAIEFNISSVDDSLILTLPAYCNRIASRLLDRMSDFYIWFDAFSPSVEWFRKLGDCALEGRNPEDRDRKFGPNPAFAAQRQELTRLQANIYPAFILAQQDLSPYSNDWTDARGAAFAMMKEYRLYTRYVNAFALEVWPDLNQELLLRPNFGFRD